MMRRGQSCADQEVGGGIARAKALRWGFLGSVAGGRPVWLDELGSERVVGGEEGQVMQGHGKQLDVQSILQI